MRVRTVPRGASADGSPGSGRRAAPALCLAITVLTLALAAPAAHAAFGVQSFVAGVCSGTPPLGKAITQPQEYCPTYYTLAGGHPDYGVTAFTINTTNGVPDGTLRDVRVDLPPGLVPDPQAIPQCTETQFQSSACPSDSQVGEVDLQAYPVGGFVNRFKLYNMVPPSGTPAEFAFNGTLGGPVQEVDIVGGVRDVSSNGQPADYGEYFRINNLPMKTLGVSIQTITSALYFFGDPSAQDGGAPGPAFFTLPSDSSVCANDQTTTLTVDSYENPGQKVTATSTTPVTATGCSSVSFGDNAAAPPTLSTAPVDGNGTAHASVAHDSPTGMRVELTVPQDDTFSHLATPDVKTISVTLPKGFSINPAAAGSLQACSDAEFPTDVSAGVSCPAASRVGSVSIHTPLLGGSAPQLTGSVYVGTPPTTGSPFRLLLDAGGDGIEIRLQGTITADPSTGQLTTVFDNSPQVPFDDLVLTLNGGSGAVLASPLSCGSGSAMQATSAITPWSGTPAATPTASITVDSNGSGGTCLASTPFSPSVSAQDATTTAGAYTGLTLSVSRADGTQYLSKVQVSLPPGLLGSIASVPQCGDSAAAAGSCPASSQIGTVTVGAGAGPSPVSLSGPVYLTGGYAGAPYGLSIVVPAVAGPYNLGTVVVRAAIAVDPHDAHLTITSDPLPTILQGVPLRVKTVSIDINRPSFLFNPTSCGPLSGAGVLTAVDGSISNPTIPLTLTGCGSLPFAPSVTATTSGSTSTSDGASLVVVVHQPSGGANLRSVAVTLPKQLSSRFTTVQQACPAATYAANPAGCPPASLVGEAAAFTPVLAGGLLGQVYLVSQGSSGLPTLNLVLSGGGVSVDLTGTIAFSAAGATTSTFGAIPDVPISTFILDLPEGPHSALSATASVCPGPLLMPTQLVGQNGAQRSSTTAVSVQGCSGVKGASAKRKKVLALLSRRYAGGMLHLRLRVAAAGRVSATGPDLRSTFRTVRRAGVITLAVPLNRAGLAALHDRHRLKLRLRLGFLHVKPKPRVSAVVRATWTIRSR